MALAGLSTRSLTVGFNGAVFLDVPLLLREGKLYFRRTTTLCWEKIVFRGEVILFEGTLLDLKCSVVDSGLEGGVLSRNSSSGFVDKTTNPSFLQNVFSSSSQMGVSGFSRRSRATNILSFFPPYDILFWCHVLRHNGVSVSSSD